MATPKPNPSFAALLAIIVEKVEFISLIVTALGIGLKYMNIAAADQLLVIGLATLSMTLFLRSFLTPPPTPHKKLLIINKLGFITSAVGIMGVLFTLLHFEGARDMLMVSGVSLVGVIGLTGVMSLRYDDTFTVLKNMITRAIPILLACAFFFFKFFNGTF